MTACTKSLVHGAAKFSALHINQVVKRAFACSLRHKHLALRSNLIQRAEYCGGASFTILSISLMQEFIAIQRAVMELQQHTSTKMILAFTPLPTRAKCGATYVNTEIR